MIPVIEFIVIFAPLMLMLWGVPILLKKSSQENLKRLVCITSVILIIFAAINLAAFLISFFLQEHVSIIKLVKFNTIMDLVFAILIDLLLLIKKAPSVYVFDKLSFAFACILIGSFLFCGLTLFTLFWPGFADMH